MASAESSCRAPHGRGQQQLLFLAREHQALAARRPFAQQWGKHDALAGVGVDHPLAAGARELRRC